MRLTTQYVTLGVLTSIFSICHGSNLPMSKKAPPEKQNQPIYGVTIDDIDDITHLPAIKTALAKLPMKPTTRIVFNSGVSASYYKPVVDALHPISFIMGQVSDSTAMKKYSVATYQQRIQDYVQQLGKKVDIWEIGNEINGEWLGKTSETIKKIAAASAIVKQQGGKTALTLYYNEGCAPSGHEMFEWTKKNVPQQIKNNVDYVLVSYYPDNCATTNQNPNWNQVFNQLAHIFPHAKLGFGEVCTDNPTKKEKFIEHFYSLKIDVPNYIGGYFWWYFRRDMVPATKPLWSQLSLAFLEEKKKLS